MGALAVRRRRTMAIVAIVVVGVALAAGVGVAAWPRHDHRPLVRLVQHVPDDVEREARAAVARFASVFAARRGCIPTAEVVLVREIEGGDARYLAEDAIVEIQIPTTPARFRESLVHELAHHVELTCPAFGELRAAWLAGVAETAWSGQERWEDRPSEQWAETVVEIVLGERRLHGDEMSLDAERSAAAAAWIAGDASR